jgi:hypothetical protein
MKEMSEEEVENFLTSDSKTGKVATVPKDRSPHTLYSFLLLDIMDAE